MGRGQQLIGNAYVIWLSTQYLFIIYSLCDFTDFLVWMDVGNNQKPLFIISFFAILMLFLNDGLNYRWFYSIDGAVL